jgi:hypothetical protein
MTRYGATIWVEGPARLEVDRLRQRWDGQFHAVAAHMTVVYPQTVDDDASIVDGCRDAVASAGRFTVRVDRWAGVRDLEAIHPTGTRYLAEAFPAFPEAIVLLPDDSGAAVLDLRRRLDAAFDQHPVLLDHPPFVTIGQGLDQRRVAEAATELTSWRPDLSFDVATVDILREDDGVFRSVGQTSLGPAA